MNLDPDVRHFMRAGAQRLETADILFKHERFLDAVYLAGYGPECALKALILTRLPSRRRHGFVQESFRSAKAHSFDYLKSQAQALGESFPIALAVALRRINSWSTNLRYQSARGDRRDAEAFLRAANEVFDWVNGRM